MLGGHVLFLRSHVTQRLIFRSNRQSVCITGNSDLGRCCSIGDSCNSGYGRRSKSVCCSYFVCLVLPCGEAPLASVVSIHLLALSKPVQPHQKASRWIPRSDRFTFTSQPIAMRTCGRARWPSYPTRAVTETTSGGAGGNRTRVQHASTSTFRGFRPTRPYSLRADESPCE